MLPPAGKIFPSSPNVLAEKATGKMKRMRDSQAESSELSERSRGTWHGAASDLQKGSNKKPTNGVCHLSSNYLVPQAPLNVVEHHRQHCDKETSQTMGLFMYFTKTTQNPQLCQRLWMNENVARFFSSESQSHKI